MKLLLNKEKIKLFLSISLFIVLIFMLVVDVMQGSSKNYFILEFIVVLFLSALSSSYQFSINSIAHYLGLGLVGLTFFIEAASGMYKIASYFCMAIAVIGLILIYLKMRLDKEENND